MIRHHPADESLLALAAGRLPGGQALLLNTHLEACASCRARVAALEAVGGALLEEAEPMLLAPESLARTLALIDGAGAPAEPAPSLPVARPALPGQMPWPDSLRDCAASRWHWMGPGMRWSRLMLPSDPSASLFLLRIAPGRSLPRHTHKQLELTQVLCGTFDDGRALFGPGDFDVADPMVHHQPVVLDGSECVCLAYVAGGLRFEGRVASMIGGLIGM
jgi:putative transcriptional regulator